ncbi:MAG: tetratricopeptide repeat protein [Candidatus Marinimicrobia bacterium]|nr:tetratricopeptide repeat protein [Candidatus Neomarinimicrobiota bacterium]
MTSKRNLHALFLAGLLLGFVACTPKEPATPKQNIEQIKMQSQMKALSAEVVKLRESRLEVEQLKASIAVMDSQIAFYQARLDEKAEEPKVEVVAAPRDPDIINLRGNIYVLIREIDSLKVGMKDLELLNDSLEMQIEQLAVQTHTMVKLEEPETEAPEKVPTQTMPPAMPDTVEEQEDPVLAHEPPMAAQPRAHGFAFNADYRMAYNDALNKYFNNDYLEAIQDFRVLIEREPLGAYADNAQYWIGECFYSLEDYESAIAEFEKVFAFPENNKSDHALFKVAISYQQLGRFMKAKETMNRFLLDYPDSELVDQARDFLKGNR